MNESTSGIGIEATTCPLPPEPRRPQHWLWANSVREDGLNDDAPARPPLVRDHVGAHVLLRLATFLGLLFIASIATGVLAFALRLDIRNELQQPYFIALVCVIASFVAYLLVALVLERRRPPIELSLQRAAGLLIGLGLGTVLISAVVGLLFILGVFKVDGFQSPSGSTVAVTLATVGFQAAIFEELVFRGFLFRYLEEGLGTWVSIAISALLFGMAHYANPNSSLLASLAIALEAGVLFGAVYVVTRSLWVCMGLHFAWNVGQALIFGVPVSGGRSVGWIKSHPVGPAWLSGGTFGAEASVVAIVLLTGVATALLVLAMRRQQIVAPVWVRRRRAASLGQPTTP